MFFSPQFFRRLIATALSGVLCICTGIGRTDAAELEQAFVFATITAPSPIAPLRNTTASDVVLLPEAPRVSVTAVAQPNKSLNLYSWAIIPGTDGSTNQNTAITNFRGEKLADGKLKLSWQPRQIFQEGAVEAALGQAGSSCTMLKTHCAPTGAEAVGFASNNCPAGNIPPDFDCSLPKKYRFFNDLVAPTTDGSEQLKLFLPETLSPSALSNLLNNTKLTGTECRNGAGCEYDSYPIGWRTTLKPMAESIIPLLKTDASPAPYEVLNVDEANGFIPSKGANSPGNPWANDLLSDGVYLPNMTQSSYSGIYNFSYFTFIRAFNPNLTGEVNPLQPATYAAQSFLPAKDLTILVDGFAQYEIYAVAEDEYRPAEGVTRENGTLVQIVRDPSLSEVVIDLSSAGLESGKNYHFALFEVRDAESIELPAELTNTILAKKVSGTNCSGDPENPVECAATLGHLVSANTELVLSTAEAKTENSPPKLQWQIFEQEGKYSADPIRSDANGEMRCGAEGKNICTFARTRFHPFASRQFFAATYAADSTKLTTQNSNSFSVRANRTLGNFFNLQNLVGQIAHFRPAEALSGVVVNSWTEEIVPEVEVELSGTVTSRAETMRAAQKTSTDGLFAFAPEPGEYFLNIRRFGTTENNFLFPSKAHSVQGDPMSGASTCGNLGIFPNLICAPTIKIKVAAEPLTRNLILDPSIRGTVEDTPLTAKVLLQRGGTAVAEARVLPNGRFSFFVAPGEYLISEVRAADGRTLLKPNLPIVIPRESNGKPQSIAPITLAPTV